ncbi:MAG: insulinase family protein [Candidatus Latescibacteria bacterium]|jgi:zinc protease|nr:insulinase family protein [Candidatus Latescibacterota bacterium]
MNSKIISGMIFIMIFNSIVSCSGNRAVTGKLIKTSESSIEPFTKVTLDNGLDVIVKEVHTAPIVAVYLWCKTGSTNENEREQGISHFYEHMFFKGTEKRGVGEIDRIIKSLGGYNNAFTSKEYTAYYVVLPSENFSLAADVLVDAIRNSSFPDQEIEKERGVIKEEINRKEDNPTGKLYEEIFRIAFPDTPYELPVLGTKKSVSEFTRDDFKNYLAKHYVPDNMAAVIVGDVKTKDAIEEIKRLTADWKNDAEVPRSTGKITVSRREGIKGFELEKDVNMSYALMAFQTSGYADLKENAVLDVASSILSEGRSSRLYRRLVEEEQLVTSVQAFIYPLKHSGLFAIYSTMDRGSVQDFKKAILEEIEKLRNVPVEQAELQKVKTMLKADFQFSCETNSDIGYTLGHYSTLGMLDNVTQYEKSIDEVTADDVAMYARKVLIPESYSIGIINQRVQEDVEVSGE